jgi:protein involved in sex pheromone biosynthesis
MALQQTCGVVLWKILAVMATVLILSGCSGRMEPEVKVVTKVEKVQIPTVALPKPLQLSDTRVFVVTKDNFEEFEKEFTELYGDLAFVALSMKDYENLALNISELKRYINQQKEIIVYYEKAVTEETKQETQ